MQSSFLSPTDTSFTKQSRLLDHKTIVMLVLGGLVGLIGARASRNFHVEHHAPTPSLHRANAIGALSDRIGIKSLLGGAGAMLKQRNLSARIGVKSVLGRAGAT